MDRQHSQWRWEVNDIPTMLGWLADCPEQRSCSNLTAGTDGWSCRMLRTNMRATPACAARLAQADSQLAQPLSGMAWLCANFMLHCNRQLEITACTLHSRHACPQKRSCQHGGMPEQGGPYPASHPEQQDSYPCSRRQPSPHGRASRRRRAGLAAVRCTLPPREQAVQHMQQLRRAAVPWRDSRWPLRRRAALQQQVLAQRWGRCGGAARIVHTPADLL